VDSDHSDRRQNQHTAESSGTADAGSSRVRVVTLVLTSLLLALGVRSADASRASCVVRIDLSTVLTAGISDYVSDGIAAAEERGCALLVVIDTPGGELEATRRIVQAFLASRAPVIAYVAPSGARAGSAGMFVTIAAHVAAMAPGTTIGAAHPVVGMGQDPEQAGGTQLARKIVNDTAVFARAIAQRRDRNVEWAEQAVRESASATAEEALVRGVIDRVAVTEDALLAALEGTSVETEAGEVELALAGAAIHDHAPTISQRVRGFVGNPSVVYLLFLIGVVGLMIELLNPGLIVPGALGAFALVLAIIGVNILPVNAGAVVLMVIGAGLLVAEVFVTSYGLLALGGTAILALGAAFLIDHDGSEFFADASLAVSWGVIVPVAVVAALVAIALAWFTRKIQRRAVVTGREGLHGHVGRVDVAIEDERSGQVVVGGERWRAIADEPIPEGREVRVDDVRGLTIHVTPVSPASGG
jgi:membrane-bound serine protease (ClpP class)